MAPPAIQVPSARFGTVLAEVREVLGFDLDEMAARSNGRFTPFDLAALEAGLTSADDETIDGLARLYGVESRLLTPPRGELVIDLVRGVVVSGDHHIEIPDDATGPVEVLERYLELVHAMRHAPPHAEIPLRTPDLEILADALDLGVGDVTTRLHQLMISPDAAPDDRRRRFRRRWIPAVGLAVAASVAVGVVLVRGGDADPADSTRPGSTSASDPASAVSPDSAPGSVVVEAPAAGTAGAEVVPTDPFAPVPVDPGETSVEVPPILLERDQPTDDPGEVQVIDE